MSSFNHVPHVAYLNCAICYTFRLCATCRIFKLCAIFHMFKPFVPYVIFKPCAICYIFTPRATCCLSKPCAICYIFTPRATCCLSKLCAIYYTFRLCAICRFFELVPCNIFKPFVPHVASLHCVPYAIRLSRSCHRHPFLLSCLKFIPLLITVKLQRKCAVKRASVPPYVRDMNF